MCFKVGNARLGSASSLNEKHERSIGYRYAFSCAIIWCISWRKCEMAVSSYGNMIC